MKDRYVKGYRLIYKPECNFSYKEGNHKGYIYEHVYVAITVLKRRLHPNEVVHHLDLDKLNNDPENLIVLTRADHIKLHMWLNKYTFVKLDKFKDKYCSTCGKKIKLTLKYCGEICYKKSIENKNKPSREELNTIMTNSQSLLQVARHYQISDNGVRKWLRSYGLSTKISDYSGGP